MNAGDQLFKERADDAKARQALENYRKLAKENPKHADIHWRLSMACQFVGHRLTKDPEAKKALFREGLDAGRLSLEKNEGCVPCHFWTGINMALYGETVGPFRTLVLLKQVREHLKTVERLEPSYASAGALRVLGLIEWKLPGMLGGNNARAKEYLEKAIALLPKEPLNYLFLIKLLRDLGETEAADTLLAKTVSLPEPPLDQPESLEAFKELETLRGASVVLGLSTR